MAEVRPYEARKQDKSVAWEIWNKNNGEVVAVGLPEETAKSRVEVANELYEQASKEEAPDA